MTGMSNSGNKGKEEKLEGLFDPSYLKSQKNYQENNDLVFETTKGLDQSRFGKVEDVINNTVEKFDDIYYSLLADKNLEKENEVLLDEKISPLNFNKKVKIGEVTCNVSGGNKKSDVDYYIGNNDSIGEKEALIPIYISARKSKYVLELSFKTNDGIGNHQKDDSIGKRVEDVKIINIYGFKKNKVVDKADEINKYFKYELNNQIKKLVNFNILNIGTFNKNVQNNNFEEVGITNQINLTDVKGHINNSHIFHDKVKLKGLGEYSTFIENLKSNHDIFFSDKEGKYNKDLTQKLLDYDGKKISLYPDSIFIRTNNVIQASFCEESNDNKLEYTLTFVYDNIKLSTISIDIFINKKHIDKEDSGIFINTGFLQKIGNIKGNNELHFLLMEKIKNFNKTQEVKFSN